MPEVIRETYQLKITLKDSKPPIWRRFLVEKNVPLSSLHNAIQIIMGWQNAHLHQFVSKGRYYGILDDDFGGDDTLDEKKYRLNQLLTKEKESISYEYDFGDFWEHKIVLEKILPFDPTVQLPFCVKAAGACPPEDVGGIWGYYNFLDALKDKNHPEHATYKDWYDGDFDPAAYDIETVNVLLFKYCRPVAKRKPPKKK